MAVPRAADIHLPVTLIAREPHEAQQHAESVLSHRRDDPGARSTALRILGLARRELGDPETARGLFRRSAAVAERAGLAEAAAHARASHQGLRALRGQGGVSCASLERKASTTQSASTLALMHRGVAAAQQGRFDAAVTNFDTARDLLRSRGDDHVLAGLLSNRGLATLYAGQHAQARADLRHALALAEEHSLGYLRGITRQNLGCLAVRDGDIARAITEFTAAADLLPESRRPALSLDHAEALLAAGMARDAARHLSSGPTPSRTTGAVADEAIAGLLRAKAHLQAGQREAAVTESRRVRLGFTSDSLWAQLARRVQHAATYLPDQQPVVAARAKATSGTVNRDTSPQTNGTPLGVDPPQPDTATDPNVAAPASPAAAGAERVWALSVAVAPLGPPSLVESGPHHTTALRALACQDHSTARQALRAGAARAVPSTVSTHLELQAHSRSPEREVARTGAEIALRAGNAAAALQWLEYGRSLSLTPGRCRDAQWSRLLEHCRAAHARAWAGDEDALDELRRLVPRLGGAQWHRGCVPEGTFVQPNVPATAELAAALGERAFVWFARTGHEATAITLVDGVVDAHPLAPPAEIADTAAKLLHAARSTTCELGTRNRGTTRLAAQLESMLITPISRAVGARPLVVSPAPYAQDLAWGMLPGLAGRAVTVVPSGRVWLDCRNRRSDGDGRVALAAGPGLGGAEAEVRSLRHRYHDPTVLTGPRARVADVLHALGGSDVAHLSAHGYAPTDTPMLSGLTLADGPLFAYDLERLSRAPALTVLSSCWGGRSRPAPGGFPLGLGTALLVAGGATVVAGVLPVSDHAIVEAMAGFHDALVSGAPPDQATATHLAASGFVCFGGG